MRYAAENVAIQPAGKPVIGKFLLALMNPGDEVLYPNPGFPIYSSLVEFLGGVAVPYMYVEHADGFRLNLEALERSIHRQDTAPHPERLPQPDWRRAPPPDESRTDWPSSSSSTTCSCSVTKPTSLIRYGCESFARLAATHGADCAVILYTFGKKYAMTGFRLGAAIGLRPVIDIIVRLNVNWESCSNHFAQYGAVEALIGDQSGRLRMLEALRERRDAGARRT